MLATADCLKQCLDTYMTLSPQRELFRFLNLLQEDVFVEGSLSEEIDVFGTPVTDLNSSR